MVKNLPAVWETWVWSLGWGDALERETATHSSILAWRIPWTEEPGRLQSMGSLRVKHDWATFTHTHAHTRHCLHLGGTSGKEADCQCRRHKRQGLIPAKEEALEKGMAAHPVFLPEESHGQRSLAGYSPWDHKESDTRGHSWSDLAQSTCHCRGNHRLLCFFQVWFLYSSFEEPGLMFLKEWSMDQ